MAGLAASANPGTQTRIFANLFRLAEPSYVKHLCPICPRNGVSDARMRLKDFYSSTMTLAAEYLTKFGFDLGHFFAKKFVLIKILIKGKSQLTTYIQLPKPLD